MSKEIELNREIERLDQEIKETKKRMKELVEKHDNTIEELCELGELLAKEKALQSQLRDALNAKFFLSARGGR